jgi:RNA polymerase sigma-70 factor (ECF subfamily)
MPYARAGLHSTLSRQRPSRPAVTSATDVVRSVSEGVAAGAPPHDPQIPAAVLEEAKIGDPSAFARLVRQYDRGLHVLAYRLLGDRDRLDDVLQEAYVKAYRALPRFRGDSKLGTWLYRIAYNACLDELERSRRVVQLPLGEVAEPADPRSSVAETVASRRDLAAALAALAPEDRAAVVMVDAHGFAYRDAGDVLGVPEGTIASRLNRARAALRRTLGDWEEG